MNIEIEILKAKECVKRSDLKQAADILEKLSTLNGGDTLKKDICFELGKTYYILKNFDLAVKNFSEALKYDKNDTDLLIMSGKALKEKGSIWKALKIFVSLKKRKKLSNDVDAEVISMLMGIKQYFLVIKYIDKYSVNNSELKNNNLTYLLFEITKLNNANKFADANALAKKTLKKLNVTDKKIKNALLNELEISSNITNLQSFPRIVTVSLLGACNLRCKMCKHNTGQFDKEKLTGYQINGILPLFPYLEKIMWVGGEVFLYEDFEKLMDLAHNYGIKQNITSNGLLITEEYAEKIVNYGVDLNLSIDSVDRFVYETIRVGGKFDVLLQNIDRIKKYRRLKTTNSKLVLNAVLSKWNYICKDNFTDIIYFAESNNFDGVNIYSDAFEKDDDVRKECIMSFNKGRDNLVKTAEKLKISLDIFVDDKYVHTKDEKGTLGIEKNDNKSSERGLICNIKTGYSASNTENEKKCLLPWKRLYVDFYGNIHIECHCPQLSRLAGSADEYQNDFKRYDNKNACDLQSAGASAWYFLQPLEKNILDVWNGKELQKIRELILSNRSKCTDNCYLPENLRKPVSCS